MYFSGFFFFLCQTKPTSATTLSLSDRISFHGEILKRKRKVASGVEGASEAVFTSKMPEERRGL